MNDGVLFGLLVMLAWGFADYVQTVPIRALGTAKTMVLRSLFTATVGMVVLLALVDAGAFSATPTATAIVSFGSLIYVAGYYAYMRGLEVGSIAVVAPVASSFAVVTLALGVMLGGEVISTERLLGIGGVLAGLALLTRDKGASDNAGSGNGFRQGVAAMGLFGAGFFVVGDASSAMGAGSLFVISSLSRAVCFLVLGLSLGGRPMNGDVAPRMLGLFVIHAVLLHGGWLAYILGTARADVSVVTALASVFAGVTMLLAVVLNRERLAAIQWLGAMIVLTGVFVLAS